jgi:hypothetical protein
MVSENLFLPEKNSGKKFSITSIFKYFDILIINLAFYSYIVLTYLNKIDQSFVYQSMTVSIIVIFVLF